MPRIAESSLLNNTVARLLAATESENRMTIFDQLTKSYRHAMQFHVRPTVRSQATLVYSWAASTSWDMQRSVLGRHLAFTTANRNFHLHIMGQFQGHGKTMLM